MTKHHTHSNQDLLPSKLQTQDKILATQKTFFTLLGIAMCTERQDTRRTYVARSRKFAELYGQLLMKPFKDSIEHRDTPDVDLHEILTNLATTVAIDRAQTRANYGRIERKNGRCRNWPLLPYADPSKSERDVWEFSQEGQNIMPAFNYFEWERSTELYELVEHVSEEHEPGRFKKCGQVVTTFVFDTDSLT